MRVLKRKNVCVSTVKPSDHLREDIYMFQRENSRKIVIWKFEMKLRNISSNK